jgi:hypothetical protein
VIDIGTTWPAVSNELGEVTFATGTKWPSESSDSGATKRKVSFTLVSVIMVIKSWEAEKNDEDLVCWVCESLWEII